MTKTMNLETLSKLSGEIENLTRETAQSVVSINGTRTRASGFVWRAGWVVTADEAIGEEDELTVTTSDGATVRATVRGRDASTDVALLRLEADTGTPPAEAGEAAIGRLALAVGAADGDTIISFGTVSRAGGLWRSMRGGEIAARIELALRLGPSAQGSLAVGPDGRVLGMAVHGPRRRVLVIPWATVDRAASRLMEHGHIPRGWLGVTLQPVRISGDRRRGVMVLHLEPDGPAAKAGVLQGDTIVSLNGNSLGRFGELRALLGPDSIGQSLTLGLVRAGSDATATVTIAERPPAE